MTGEAKNQCQILPNPEMKFLSVGRLSERQGDIFDLPQRFKDISHVSKPSITWLSVWTRGCVQPPVQVFLYISAKHTAWVGVAKRRLFWGFFVSSSNSDIRDRGTGQQREHFRAEMVCPTQRCFTLNISSVIRIVKPENTYLEQQWLIRVSIRTNMFYSSFVRYSRHEPFVASKIKLRV